ncbi:zinc metallopeptidase [Lachnospiraceae bacterium NSJ-143]|nr:zinc metallopeptidase [Lachnospiraceae bacterium NSJ-143]
MFYFNFQYIYLLIPAFILALYAQSKVNSTFAKYSRVRSISGMTGAQVAEELMHRSGIYDVRVERVAGNLTDHYDPAHKVLRLSDSVYSSPSLAAIGVAAHETGHAVQHSVGYAPLSLRSAMVPLTNISSRLAMPLILIGILFGSSRGSDFGYLFIQAGIVLFAMAVVFSIVTLPVEFNASKRAVQMLGNYGILSSEELTPVRQVLSAAALTYVAAAISAIASLLRLILIFGRRNDR